MNDCNVKKTHRYQIECARHVSGMTFIIYAQGQKIGKTNNVQVFGSNKTKGLRRIAKIHVYQRA